MALDRPQVIKVAIDLLDQVGLDGLSLRRLAKELGVQAPALYWHFTNKQALLDQMAEAIQQTESALRPLAPGETWQHWLTERARDLRRAMNAHRDGAMLAASTHPQPSQWADIELQLSIMVDAGLTAPDALRAVIAVGNYISGFTLEEQADRLRGDPRGEHDQEGWDELLATMSGYPLFAEALRVVGDPQSDTAFESGLRIIIDGIQQRIAAAAQEAPPC